MKRKAASLSPLTSKATIGPPPAICRLASACLRMIGAAGIEHARHLRPLGEEIGDRGGRGAVPLDPQRQRLEAFQQHPGIERAERRAGMLEVIVQLLLDELLAARARRRRGSAPGRRYAWWPNRPRCRRRAAIGRCSSGVANTLSTTTSAPACLRDLGHALDIDQLEHGIGRRLEEEGARVGPDRRFPGVEIAPVDQRGLDAVARQQILDDIAAAAEQRARRDHMIAGLQMAEQRSGDGGHAARGAARGVARLPARTCAPRTWRRSGWRSGYRRSLPRRP